MKMKLRQACLLLLLSACAGCGGGRVMNDDNSPSPPQRDDSGDVESADGGAPAADGDVAGADADGVSPAPPPADGDEADGGAPPPRSAEPVMLSEEQLAGGWISLFDGQSLFGWTREGDVNWQVKEGVIIADEGEVGLLCTTCEFADYVFRVDFRAGEKTNSGIFLRTLPQPDDPAKDCYELNIAPPDNPFPTGSLVGREKVEGEYNQPGWHTYEVTVQGNVVAVTLDGQQILVYSDEEPLWRGHIGLQHNSGKIEFKNVMLQPLSLESIFNGENLDGWIEYPDMDSKFTVMEEGELHVAGGKGMLESARLFGDFVLQLECRTNAENLNSGIFFRCVQGEEMNGYESQIHNGYHGDDRTKPVDFGTGGIFRRQEARRVVADDKKWFHKTIIAHGSHMAAWVNGYQVSDWTDAREPNDNPREGLRTEPGTLMIQGHDEMTDISFRNLRAAEMPPRKTD